MHSMHVLWRNIALPKAWLLMGAEIPDCRHNRRQDHAHSIKRSDIVVLGEDEMECWLDDGRISVAGDCFFDSPHPTNTKAAIVISSCFMSPKIWTFMII